MPVQSVLGRSGNKTVYHCATLVGPWEEERRQFGMGVTTQPLDVTRPIDDMTIYKESFLTPTPAQIAAAKPPGCFASEAPHELMFYHGDLMNPVKSQIPLTELSWTDRKVEPYTSPETLDIMGVSKRQTRSNAMRRNLGVGMAGEGESENRAIVKECAFLRSLQNPNGEDKQENNAEASGYKAPPLPPIGRVAERNRLLTTKQVTIDSTGVYLKKNLHCYPATSSDCIGGFMKSKDNVMNKTNLRVEWEDE